MDFSSRITLITLILLGLLALFSLNSNSNAKADSTISIPVPESSIKDRKFTLSIKIPPNTEPLDTSEKPVKPPSKRSLITWNNNPLPKISKNDEFFKIMNNFKEKGWLKSNSAKYMLQMRNIDKYMAVRMLESVCYSVLEILQAPNIGQVIRKVNLSSSDIEDLRRMVQRFNTELISFGVNTAKLDKDLLLLQEKLKIAKQGILKVLKVEGLADGGTIIHLGVE